MRRSWQSALVNDVYLRVRGSGGLSSADRLRREVAALALRPESFAPPARIESRTTLSVSRHDGWPVYELRPTVARGPLRVTVVHLHGGCYVWGLAEQHWDLAAHLARAVPARVLVPVYPLVPAGGTASEVVPSVAALVAEETERPGARVVLSGDSAGGGLALAAAQVLRDTNRPLPDRLGLVSPWLDVTMTHPGQAAVEPRDRMLRRPGLAEAGRLWAGRLDVTDPLVSPLHGDLAGLPPLTVLAAGDDVLVTDARELHDAATAAGVAVDLHEAPAQPHNLALIPTPEGRAARDLLVGACRAVAEG